MLNSTQDLIIIISAKQLLFTIKYSVEDLGTSLFEILLKMGIEFSYKGAYNDFSSMLKRKTTQLNQRGMMKISEDYNITGIV